MKTFTAPTGMHLYTQDDGIKVHEEEKWTEPETVADVNEEITAIAIEIFESWFDNDEPIDWDNFWDRMEGYLLKDGTKFSVGSDTDTPAIRKIQKIVRAYKRQA